MISVVTLLVQQFLFNCCVHQLQTHLKEYTISEVCPLRMWFGRNMNERESKVSEAVQQGCG